MIGDRYVVRSYPDRAEYIVDCINAEANVFRLAIALATLRRVKSVLVVRESVEFPKVRTFHRYTKSVHTPDRVRNEPNGMWIDSETRRVRV